MSINTCSDDGFTFSVLMHAPHGFAYGMEIENPCQIIVANARIDKSEF